VTFDIDAHGSCSGSPGQATGKENKIHDQGHNSCRTEAEIQKMGGNVKDAEGNAEEDKKVKEWPSRATRPIAGASWCNSTRTAQLTESGDNARSGVRQANADRKRDDHRLVKNYPCARDEPTESRNRNGRKKVREPAGTHLSTASQKLGG